MAFETAFRFKDPDVVQKIKSVIMSLGSGGQLHKGTEILSKIEMDTSLSVNTGLLYDLIAGGVIVSRHPAKQIEDYLFDLKPDVAESYLQRESYAAKVVQEYEKRNSSVKPLGFTYVATIPPAFSNVAGGFVEIEPALIRLIAEAESDLWIINPFFDNYGAQRLLSSMIGAAKSGVKIRILGRQLMKDEGQGSSAAVRDIVLAFVAEELASMIEIRDFYHLDEQGRQLYALHTKMIIADESIAYIGSANLTRHCLRNNFELGVILRGECVRPLSDLTRNLWHEAEAINLKEIADS